VEENGYKITENLLTVYKLPPAKESGAVIGVTP
jgi:hypothetical protein